MGQSESPYELAGKLHAFGAAVGAVPVVATREALASGKRILQGSLTTVAPSQRLRGVGRRGAKLGVRYGAQENGAEVSGWLSATGPWQLIENDTKAGVRQRKRRTGRGRTRFVGPIAGYYHPGTEGKHPWAKGAQVVIRTAPVAFRRGVAGALKRVF